MKDNDRYRREKEKWIKKRQAETYVDEEREISIGGLIEMERHRQ